MKYCGPHDSWARKSFIMADPQASVECANAIELCGKDGKTGLTVVSIDPGLTNPSFSDAQPQELCSTVAP